MIYLPDTTSQLYYLIYSLLFGVLSFIVYDFLRFFRVLISRSGFTLFSDVLFFIITAYTFTIFTLTYGYGVFRYYAIMGSCAGFALALLTIGRLSYYLEQKFAYITRKVLAKALKNLKYVLYNICVIFHIGG